MHLIIWSDSVGNSYKNLCAPSLWSTVAILEGLEKLTGCWQNKPRPHDDAMPRKPDKFIIKISRSFFLVGSGFRACGNTFEISNIIHIAWQARIESKFDTSGTNSQNLQLAIKMPSYFVKLGFNVVTQRCYRQSSDQVSVDFDSIRRLVCTGMMYSILFKTRSCGR